MSDRDALKRAAASAAVERVRDGMVLGLGTGSTVGHFLELLGERIRDGELAEIAGVPTSVRTASAAHARGVSIVNLEEHEEIDLTVDGADEVDPSLDLVKGLGGALLREKVVAQSSRRVVIVVDDTKLVDRLGTKAPLPIEVIPFGWSAVRRFVRKRGAEVTLRKEEGEEPFVTDNGNYVLDCRFPDGFDDPRALDRDLRSRAGLLETGIFTDLADEVLVASADGVRTVEREPAAEGDS